ncbi:hypothetical protein IJG29_00525 [Candidatus Saccharibacteria bacterium]|nr:hypothetical protein [Candidatus Saccharibacteria bacterium]
MSVSNLKKRFYFVAADYFRFFAKMILKRWKPRIIAVTGSAGKTTMLNMLEHEIGKRAHYSHDANSAFGVSFDILGLKGVSGSKIRWVWLFIAAPFLGLLRQRRKPYYIVEIDGERPHEAEFNAEWLKPEVTIWVSIGTSHAAQFEKLVEEGKYKNVSEAIAAEFANLPAYTKKRVYIDADSKVMVQATADIDAKVIPIKKTLMKKYVVYPDSTDFTYGDTTFHFNHPEPKDVAFNLFVLQDLMKYLKLPFNSDFSNMKIAPGRSSYFKGIKGVDIIDSSYNAHMISMRSALDMMKRLHAEHKWLIIGDIVEQGSLEEAEHKKLAELIAAVKPDRVVLVGRRTKEWTAPRLKELGVSAVATTDPKKALSFIEKRVRGNETLFFKGSQYLEWIVEKLLADPKDAKKLCRREKAATLRRKKWGLDS